MDMLLRPFKSRSDSWTAFKSFYFTCICQGSRGRVVKAMDLKSIGVSPRRFESCRLRWVIIVLLILVWIEIVVPCISSLLLEELEIYMHVWITNAITYESRR